MTERTIGQLANDAGVGIETIRYYQRIGLISKPQRSFNGWRRYPDRTLRLLQSVRLGRQLGFSLSELRKLLAHAQKDSSNSCLVFRSAAEAKIAEIDSQMALLQARLDRLRGFIDTCRARQQANQCPMVEGCSC
jgi:MerR family mercuric resistance operon transcriptional regulator